MEKDEEMSSDWESSDTDSESDAEVDEMVSQIAEKIFSRVREASNPGSMKLAVEPTHDSGSDKAGESDNDSESGHRRHQEDEEGSSFLSFSAKRNTARDGDRVPIPNEKVFTKRKSSNVPKHKSLELPSSLQPSAKADVYINVNAFSNPKTKTFQDQKFKQLDRKSKDTESEVLKKSVLSTDLEKKDSIKSYEESRRQVKLQRQRDRANTKGKKWFDMQAAEMTEEKKNDLNVLQMRKVLDPKRFYKNNDMKGLPKFFQMGKVVESAADFYHARIPKKQRKATIVDELLADAQFRKFNKRKYVEIQEKTMRSRGRFKHAKRLKNKKR